MLNKFYRFFVLSFLLLPVVSSAVFLKDTRGFFEAVLDIVQKVLIPLVFTLALLAFFWGVAKYIWSEGQGKAEGKQIMVWGVVGLFVMSSVWGLVWFIKNELEIGHETAGTIPTVLKQ